MNKMNTNRRNFLNKKSLLLHRLNKEVLEDGIAYIPCYAESMEDIISKYSIRGCESLNSEFSDYIMDFIECIPTKYPIVLEIYGKKFTEEEKRSLLTRSSKTETMYLAGQFRRTDITVSFLWKW